jgi:NAD(P)-dependent dehydrogenase (short-subunit alcohol dehydrogenase family)/acyl carrier protein
MEVLAEKTGYTVDMLDLSYELESDLGIDSIRRVEIMAEVQDKLGVEAKDVDALSRTRTVGDVILAIQKEMSQTSSSPATTSNTISAASVELHSNTDVDLCNVEAVQLTAPDQLSLNWPANRPIVVVDDGSDLTTALCSSFGASAVALKATDYSEASIQASLKRIEQAGPVGGVVFQFSASGADKSVELGYAMLLAKHVKKSLEQPIEGGRTFFIGVARMDGCLGLSPKRSSVSLAEGLEFAQRGALMGLCKSADLEWDHVFARGIDIEEGMDAQKAAVAIFQEAHCPNQDIREVGYTSQGVRSTTRGTKLASSAVSKVTASDVFIVSGGARGITPLCVKELAQRVGGGTYILLGRSPLMETPAWAQGIAMDDDKALKAAAMKHLKAEAANGGPKPTPKAIGQLAGKIAGALEVRGSIDNINAVGGKAIYASCDVGSVEKVKSTLAALKQEHGIQAFTGVFHASGVLRDRLLESKTLDEFEAVYNTKVRGLVNILSCIDMSSLKHLVNFSSLAGFHGNRGQSDYSMANEALNKIGYQLAAQFPHLTAKSFDFGPWSGGMVNATLEKHFRSMGVQIIPRAGGSETVAQCILYSGSKQVLVGNWGLPAVTPLSQTHTVRRTISIKSNPFLDSHMIQKRRVLPMTVAIGDLAQVAKSIYRGYHLWGIEDARLFAGVTLTEDVACEITLTRQSESAGKIKVEASLNAFKNGKLAPAYKCVVVLGNERRPELSERFDKPDADPACGCATYDGVTLFHGKAFQGISEVLKYSKDRFVAKLSPLSITTKDRGQFAGNTQVIDPFVNDMIFQSMLVWARNIRNSASLPAGCERMTLHKSLPTDKDYYISLQAVSGNPLADSTVKFDFKLLSDQNEVFVAGRAGVTLSPTLTY